MAKYKWNNPHEWLADKITEYQGQNNTTQLANIARCLAQISDPAEIQDIFQQEMNAESYFDKIEYFIVHEGTGETVKDKFDTEDDAYNWLRQNINNLQPNNINEYAVEKVEQD